MTNGSQAIRNVCFVGHPSSGKSTLVDALSHLAGASPRKGSVADKTNLCDTEPEEQDRQHTLQIAMVHAEHDGHSFNFVDTPGYPEFTAETLGAVFATELTVGVVSAQSGVTFNLAKKLKAAQDMGRGRAIVITHLDAENTDFDSLVESMRERIGEICVPIELPDESGPGFSAVSETSLEDGTDWRKRLFDRVIDACEDEDLVMEYLESEVLSDEQLEELFPAAIRAGALIPVLICNPESGLGGERVLDFLAKYGPAPATVKDSEGNDVTPDASGPPIATVFNIKSDPHVGKVCMARIWSGTITQSDTLKGQGDGKPEKMGGLFHLVGKRRDAIESAGAGDLIAFSKVENLSYGEGFSNGATGAVVDAPNAGVPMVSLAVTPKSRADEQKIGEALHKLVDEDPTLQLVNDNITHELVIHGMSDMHLLVMEERLKRRFGVEIETALPQIAYRETIRSKAEGHHRHKKQSGGRGQFGECYLRVRPLEEGSGVDFKDSVVGGSIPRNLIPAIEKGIREHCSEGVMTKSVVVDVEIEVYDGKFHAVDSDEASFKMAGKRAFRDAFERATPILLEPVMELEVHAPTDDAGQIFSDLTSQRRGHVLDQLTDGQVTVIKAEVPLSTIQTYHRELKSQTAGEGDFSMKFSRYAPVPGAEQTKILQTLGRNAVEEE
jgi:elongation factor G